MGGLYGRNDISPGHVGEPVGCGVLVGETRELSGIVRRYHSGTVHVMNRITDDSPVTSTPGTHLMLTATDVACLLQLSVSTIHRLDATGVLPCVRIGRSKRWSAAAVTAFTVGPPPAFPLDQSADIPTWVRGARR
jgi:hypothetical protein